jgi:hypothetical protein
MQPARIKSHAKEHTNNPIQTPNFRGHAGTMARTRVYKPPTVLQDHQGRENKRASVDSSIPRGANPIRLRLFQPSPLSPRQVPGQARARMQHKHKQARHEQAHSVMHELHRTHARTASES